MSKIIKNQTASIVEVNDVGLSIPASGQLTVNPTDFDDFSSSDDIVELIGNGTLVVNNGDSDLGKSDGIRFVQGGFSNKINLADDLLESDRVKVDVIGTLGDGQVKVSSNDSSSSFLENKIISGDNKIQVSTINDGSDEDLQILFQPGNVGTSELSNDANFIDSSGAPVQPSDISDFETSSELDARDVNNRNRSNHTGTQLSSTISDFTSAVQTAETDTSLSFNNTTKILSYTNEAGTTTNVDLTQFLDDTNLARIVSGTLNSGTGIATFTRDDATTFDVDFSSLNDQAFINAAIDTHEVSITNHDDVNTSGASNGDALVYNGSNWEPSNAPIGFKDFIRDTTGLINNGTGFDPYLTLTTTVPVTANYKISWSYTWSLDSTQNDFLARVQVDNSTTIMEHQQEPKDSAGTATTLPDTDGGTDTTGTNQKHLAAGFDIISLTAGSHTIDLDFATESVGVEAAIYRGCLTIERWD